jgi:cyclophilin family peptidyl-prolyl cis-trans isomerase
MGLSVFFVCCVSFVLLAWGSHLSATDKFLIDCANDSPDCWNFTHSTPPPLFSVKFVTTVGAFTINVNTSWAPPMATRFYILSNLGYFEGGAFYRVLNINATERFVTQFGLRGSPDVDAAWSNNKVCNDTVAVAPPGNIRGSVAFATDEVPNDGTNPHCTAAYCSRGFTVELFVNLASNTRLDASDFSPFGWVDDADMAVVDRLYARYGEVADLCAVEPSDPFCVWDSARHQWSGVNVTRLQAEGRGYLADCCPLLSEVEFVHVNEA